MSANNSIALKITFFESNIFQRLELVYPNALPINEALSFLAQTDTVDWGHAVSPLRLPKVSEIASSGHMSPSSSPQQKPTESDTVGTAAGVSSSSASRPLVISSSSSPSIDQKRVVEIVDAAAYAADKERREDRARKLLEAFDDE